MKKLLLTFILIAVTASFGFAQLSQKMIAKLPDETAVVKDSSGHQYNYTDWKFMVASGKFSIRGTGKPVTNSNYPQEFLLYSLFDVNGQRIVTAAMKRRKPAESEQFHTGDVFKPFSDKDINGEKFDLKKMAGKVFVINFWFIGCPPCRAEIPDLNTVVDHYKDNKDVVFIAICLDESYDIKDFIKTSPYNYHIISSGRYLASKYGVHLYPTNVVVNRDGKVAYSSVGGVPSNPYWMTKTIDEALVAPISPAQ